MKPRAGGDAAAVNAPNSDAMLHVRGLSLFVDDYPEPCGCLHAFPVVSPTARGALLRVDAGAAASLPGVAAVLAARDIPGENQVGGVILDEPLFAEDRVDYLGQPVALVVASGPEAARKGARLVRVETTAEPPVLDPRDAFARGELISPPRTFACGDVDGAWDGCAVVVEGRVESGAQEHAYLEPQSSFAVPREDGGVRIVSSTQSPSLVQRIAARVLGLPMHMVEVEAPRLGGGFGGKEDQATSWAVMAALSSFRLRRPVKLVLRRGEDMRCTGKRHPYSSDYKLGLTAEGRLRAFEVSYYQNSGAAADLSTAILERTLFHAAGPYFIPNVRATGYCCRTNLPPNTAFRGFGAPQAHFVLECALHHAARELGVERGELQRRNLLREGDAFHYGQRAKGCTASRCWDELERRFRLGERRREAGRYNASSRWEKRGIAVMPVCFGVSFTTQHLNQTSALVHVYGDGSVGVSTGAVEMGQGTRTKIRTVAARALGVDPALVRVENTNTTVLSNLSPTAASTGPDMNGHAARIACGRILERLLKVAAGMTGGEADDVGRVAIAAGRVTVGGRDAGIRWEELVRRAYLDRVDLSAHAHYATPGIHFDRDGGKGEPFAYHAYGAAMVEATLDALRGVYRVDAVRVVHDAGESLDPLIDRGQVEGGLLQGIGWVTMEEILHSPEGDILTDSLSTYKVPDLLSAPGEVETHFLEGSFNPAGVFGSKTVGEPPFLYGIGAFFALLDAMRAFRPDLRPGYAAPLTHERVFAALWGG